jgi:hypothetical protein
MSNIQSDNVARKLSSNLGDGYEIETLYSDDERGIYLIFNTNLPKTSAVIHLHDIIKDVGTSYTFGDENDLKGNVGLGHLSDEDLLDILGQGLLQDLHDLIDPKTESVQAQDEISTNSTNLRLAHKVQEWLNSMEWNDVIDLDEENATSQLRFTYTIQEQNFDVYIETDEDSETVRVFIYAPINVLPKKADEFTLLLGRANAYIWSGAFITLPGGRICWRHFVNFAETDPSLKSIDNMFQYGIYVYSTWFEELSEVALTKKTAQDVFDRMDAEDNQ